MLLKLYFDLQEIIEVKYVLVLFWSLNIWLGLVRLQSSCCLCSYFPEKKNKYFTPYQIRYGYFRDISGIFQG